MRMTGFRCASKLSLFFASDQTCLVSESPVLKTEIDELLPSSSVIHTPVRGVVPTPEGQRRLRRQCISSFMLVAVLDTVQAAL